jgi:predicted RNA binding protein YcfA (HicA-like mRNA interferase family)
MGFTTTAAELIAFLTSMGFHKETGRGKHGVKMVLGKQRIPIPAHKRDLKRGTVQDILDKAGYSENDILDWRDGK